uniref:Uncharacterized protein n=1 Tax=Anabas testudineus TaxID=64144 RepID=A0AAQ6IB49_ANATE
AMHNLQKPSNHFSTPSLIGCLLLQYTCSQPVLNVSCCGYSLCPVNFSQHIAIRLLEGLEEQEVKGFNRGPHSKLETMQMQEFVEDLGFWRVLLLLVVIALLSLGIAYYVSGVLPFSSSQLELVH